jgi:hypothetical protein
MDVYSARCLNLIAIAFYKTIYHTVREFNVKSAMSRFELCQNSLVAMSDILAEMKGFVNQRT